MEKRRAKRYHVGVIESFNFHESNKAVEIDFPLEISLRDISAGGLGIKSNVIFEKDTTLSLNLELEEESYVVIGKIVWCEPCGDFYDCGLKLIYMPEPLRTEFDGESEQLSKYSN